MQQAMQDPKVAAQMKAMQEAMQRPEVQQQMAEMQAYMQNQQLQQRMQELKNDPEFKEMFEEIRTGGIGAMMKYMNDPKVLAKIGERIGDIQPAPGAAVPSSSGAPAQQMPEITNLIEAARYGDEEAVEDFIAVGKDVNAGDNEQRTPLHYAAGYDHLSIAKMLMDEGANLAARDSKGNTPLHYAAGYGRGELVALLLERGADKAAVNDNGKSAFDLATADARNPLSQQTDLLQKLRP